MNRCICLSSPRKGTAEFVWEAFDTGWIAPIWPHIESFERKFTNYVNAGHTVPLSSGVTSLHLALAH